MSDLGLGHDGLLKRERESGEGGKDGERMDGKEEFGECVILFDRTSFPSLLRN